ncbi:MAG TPA: dynamin family protein [Solirubrobacteraceae bacterium]|nr:dynamin family protein [Solirubrobacteraceae bacterium]
MNRNDPASATTAPAVDPPRTSDGPPITPIDPRTTANGHGGALGEYRRRKLALAEPIRELMTIAHERHDDEREATGRELLARLAEDAFQLAVVGQFSRGKSTLMNAILGEAYLPTGALPMTSVLTTVRYGSEPRAWVRRAGSSFPIDVPLDQLVRYVAQQSGERQELQVVSAEVELPAEILRLGFSFVDTPGIGSAIAANTATTEEFLPHADAVIFVTGCDAPLSAAEQRFLATVRRHVEKLFLVVNKTDLVGAAEAEDVIRFVRSQLSDDGTDARVHPLSARRALLARTSGDRAGLSDSGLPALEQSLVQFLTREKSHVFLAQTCGRARRLLAREQSDLQLARAAQAQEPSAREDTDRRLQEHVADLSSEAHTLAAGVRDQLAARLLPLLIERSRFWPQELSETISALIDRPSNGRRTRQWLSRQLAATLETAGPSLDRWLGERATDMHTLLFATAGEHIQAMLELRHRVQPLAASLYGLADDTNTIGGWSPADLPPLHTPRVAFGERIDRPARLSPARFDDPERQLHAALATAADAYCQQARNALAQAAESWTGDLDARVQADLQEAAERVRRRLEVRYRQDHAARLRALDASLAAFDAELAAWTPAPTSDQQGPEELSPFPAGPSTGLSCTICQRIATVPFDYLAHAQYELAAHQDRRAEHAGAGGFCALHTWLYAQSADPVGIALTHAELAQALAAQLTAARTTQQVAEVLAHYTPTPDRCPVCRALDEAERDAVADVLDALARAEPAEGNEPPVSLCAGHLVSVLAADPPAEQAQSLIATFAGAMRRAAEDMRTFALKRKALRRGLVSNDERTAYLQTVLRVAGHRELARPWRTDDDDRL